MRTFLFLLGILGAIAVQSVHGQTLETPENSKTGTMAVVKEGGKYFGLHLSTRTVYKWENNRWMPFGGLDVRIPDRRLPYLGHAVAHKRDRGGYYIGVSGFGHLWAYHQGQLQRLDTTFFAGSNFGADRFVYHDTLYSHGGYGFWINHGVLSYFEPRFKEWERSSLSGYTGPVQPYPISGFSGKDKRWVWSVSTFPDVGVHELFVPNGLVYELNLRAKSMKPAGHVRPAVWRLLGEPIAAWDSVVLVAGKKGALLVDMAKNEVRRVPQKVFSGASLTPMDDWGAGCVALDDTLEIFTLKDRVRSRIMAHDRWALRDLWNQSEPLGAFIEPIWLNGLKRNFWLPLLTAIVAAGAWWMGKQKKDPIQGAEPFVHALDLYERRLLVPLLLADQAKKWTSYELDAALQIQDKTWENQRKIRKTTLNDLNDKALQFLDVSPLISEERDLEDRREKRYFVSDNAVAWKKELIDLLHTQHSPA
jgi:hypothetical protein